MPAAKLHGTITMASLPPPIIGTDVGNSAPGVPQPIIVSGGQSLPPSFPLAPAGTWLPPPLIGSGGNAPFPTPVVPPGTGVSEPNTKIAGGPSLPPAFPLYTSPGPVQPIVLTSIVNTSQATSQNPTTPGTQPIVISSAPNIPQLPDPIGHSAAEAAGFHGIHARLAEDLASVRGVRAEPPTPENPHWQPTGNNNNRKKKR